MSNRGNTKKRRVGGGGARVSIDGGGESGGGSELAAIKSMMQELVQQNRTQTNMMQSMQGKINNMQGEITRLSNKCISQNNTQTNMIQSMKGEITRLTQKCNKMDRNTVTLNTNTKKRFDGVEEKLKYQDILLQNQKWKYSAERPSNEYWLTIEEHEENEAEEFLKQIKKCTEEMRYGQGDGEVEIHADLPYNEVFLPHWQEFANALKQYHYHLKHSTELRANAKLWLVDVELPDKVVDLLSDALKSTHFQKIKLKDNNFGSTDFTLNYLKTNTEMKELIIVNNFINSMDDINKLCKIVKVHPSIEIIELPECKGEDIDGYEMFKKIMNAGKNKLSNFNLCDNGISTEGGTFISDFLAKSTILESLSLEGNELDDQDAFKIVGALKHNKTLRFLRLIDNNLTKTGWTALRKAEFNNTSLNAAADSNHTCNIEYPPDGSDEIEGVDISEMNGSRNCLNAFHPIHVRQMKIYTVLSARNRDCSNVDHFEDIPVELLPDMLSSIQSYSNYHTEVDTPAQNENHVNPLSLVYEVCRNWEESIAVFEALSS